MILPVWVIIQVICELTSVYSTGYHCVRSVRIRSYSGPYFPAFGLNTERYGVNRKMQENADQNNSE